MRYVRHAIGYSAVAAMGIVLASAQAPTAQVMSVTAASANVAQPGQPVRITVQRWSTDEERDGLVAALNTPPPPPPAPPEPPPDAAADPPADPPQAGRGDAARGRGAAGREGGGREGGARGRGDGPPPLPPPPPPTPIQLLAMALDKAPTVGYIWTEEVTGYSIKYAIRTPLAGGGERIILASNRRLGAYTPAWTLPKGAEANDYTFTLLELRLTPKGTGEGRASLTTPIAVDPSVQGIALADYAAAPVILQNVKR